MTIGIRQTRIEDAPQIAEIIKLAFHKDATVAHIPQIEHCIKKGNLTFVADLDERIVGFSDGFITISADREKRRELDLLAVHPDYHGQGIGKKIIEYYTNLDIDADVIRALIAVGNTRMEKALTRFGYQPQDDVHGLYVCSSTSMSNASAPDDSHLIPVTTFTYNGIWLEGQISQQAIDAALSSKQDVVGAVVPITDEVTITLLQSADFSFIKQYREWRKN